MKKTIKIRNAIDAFAVVQGKRRTALSGAFAFALADFCTDRHIVIDKQYLGSVADIGGEDHSI